MSECIQVIVYDYVLNAMWIVAQKNILSQDVLFSNVISWALVELIADILALSSFDQSRQTKISY